MILYLFRLTLCVANKYWTLNTSGSSGIVSFNPLYNVARWRGGPGRLCVVRSVDSWGWGLAVVSPLMTGRNVVVLITPVTPSHNHEGPEERPRRRGETGTVKLLLWLVLFAVAKWLPVSREQKHLLSRPGAGCYFSIVFTRSSSPMLRFLYTTLNWKSRL